MLVTHVRGFGSSSGSVGSGSVSSSNSNSSSQKSKDIRKEVSERDLEALALYMGHSINMQRTSYDRRTVNQKVAPAVKLLQSVNGNVGQ